MFRFNKARSSTPTFSGSAPSESDNESSKSGWSPMVTSKRFVPARILNLLRSDDLPHLTDYYTCNVSPVKTKPTTPFVAKKLQRSRHSIDTSLVPAVVERYDLCSPRSPAVSIASRRSVDIIKEHHKVLSRKSWISGDLDAAIPHSGECDTRRKSCDVFPGARPPAARFNGDSSRSTIASDHTFSKSDNSGRSWAWDSTSDEDLDRSMWSASSRSHEDDDDVDDALEFAEAEERFLHQNPGYAATTSMDYIRRDQYPKLARYVYMDYASLAISSRFQMEEHMRLVMAEGHMFGANSSTAAEYAASSQERLLQLLHTTKSEYSIVFTTGLKASYRLIANAYPFQKGSPLLLCQDNHDAVGQLISAAVKVGGKTVLAPLEETDLTMTKANIRPLMKRLLFQPSGSLFVYPAQSSVTGIRHSMHWINKAHKSGWHVLLDTSTLLPTGTLDLQKHQPDFVVGSFQNIVGYPSGMGFLLVRRSSFLTTHVQNSNAITLTSKVNPTFGKDCHIVAEDESLSKLSFAGLDLGLQHLQSLGLDVINKRVTTLATWMVHKLKGLRQIDPDDWSLVNVYSPYMTGNRGNIISFNVLDSAGEVVGPQLVQRLAAKHQITLAVGSFSNPGVANLLGPAKRRLKNVNVFEKNFDFECLQVSLGPMSNFEDAYKVVNFLTKFRSHDYVSSITQGFSAASRKRPVTLESHFQENRFY